MVRRHNRILGLGVIVAAGPAFGQAPASTPPTGKPAAEKPAKHITVAQATMKPVPAMAAAPPAQPGAPHTLAEALAATYSSQPTLLAERAKLRATDENVPQALSGWRPTVVMAGTAGYGDGMSRSFSSSAGQWRRPSGRISAGNLETARGTFQQVVGFLPPADLVAPQPLALPVKTARDASIMAANNNPLVVAALFNDAAAKDAIDVAFAQLMPQVSFQGQVFQQNNAAARSTQVNGYQAVGQLAVPVYQGGAEYSAVRQARQSAQQTTQQVDDARRTAVQAAVQAWEQLVAARASADSTREAVRANEIALEGVEREAIVGSRTTLDVLNAQQTLLNSRVSLVQNLAQIVTDSYQVAQAIGRLTAHDLHLPVPLYDETAYYEAVKNKWVGLGDYAKDQPGR